MSGQGEIVAQPGARLAAGDPTRVWGVRGPDGVERWPGLTRPEATTLTARVAWDEAGEPDRTLATVTLDVVLSDGAGPHLLDADGTLVLVVGDHGRLDGGVAMGEPGPGRVRLGLVHGMGDTRHVWLARVDVPHADRVAALDELAEAGDAARLRAWARTWGTPRTAPGLQ